MVSPIPRATADQFEGAGADMVLKLNKMSGTLKCAMADAALFLQLMSSVDHLDLLHIDIQGAEGPLLSDARVQQVLSRKVYRIIVGTHWEEMHRFVAESFKDWITVFSLPQGFWDCDLPTIQQALGSLVQRLVQNGPERALLGAWPRHRWA